VDGTGGGQVKVTDFCILECQIQEDPKGLPGMLAAFAWGVFLCKRGMRLDRGDLLIMGNYINHKVRDFRKTPVFFKDLSLGLPPELIDRTLDNLIVTFNMQSITPEEFYQEFERIHPFEDGNGRVGAILFNMLNHSMNDPILPPKYKRR
jgi:hypothetical protein